jgi:16S rRNA (guanine1207-N2)-methyltransferase
VSFDFAALRRYPDVEAPNLFAADATDRLLLDTAAQSLQTSPPGTVVVLGDHYGALTLGAAASFGCAGIRSHTDAITGELALEYNAYRCQLTGAFEALPLTPALFAGARVVLIQAPKALDELTEWVGLISAHAAPDVEVYLGGRTKYLTQAMNTVLGAAFAEVTAGLARQKSRVITARRAKPAPDWPSYPRREWHPDLELWVCAHGGAFAGTGIDIGTRRLLAVLGELPAAERAIDLGCGTGVLAAMLATRRRIAVLGSDRSAAAIASAAATMAANGLADRVQLQRDDALSLVPEASTDLIVCNPPFHLGSAVHTGAALKLFDAAHRTLAPGGQLWTVFNNHLGYAPLLRQRIGPTRLVLRDSKFTVTATVRGDPG